MSVYIPGISMPTNCSECAFCGYYGNGEHMCDIIQKAVEYESAKMSRLDDCPLIPVHDHGDLIDRQAFRFEMDKHYPFDKATQSKHGIEDVIKSAVLRMLFDTPTIIPASGGTDNE